MCNEGAAAHRWNWKHTEELVEAFSACTCNYEFAANDSIGKLLAACAKLSFYCQELCNEGIRRLDDMSIRRTDAIRILLAAATLGHEMTTTKSEKSVLQWLLSEESERFWLPGAEGDGSPRRLLQLSYALTLLQVSCSTTKYSKGSTSRRSRLPAWLWTRLEEIKKLQPTGRIPEWRMLAPVLVLNDTDISTMTGREEDRFEFLGNQHQRPELQLLKPSDNSETGGSQMERNIRAFLTAPEVSFGGGGGLRFRSSSSSLITSSLALEWKKRYGLSVDFVLELLHEEKSSSRSWTILFEVDGPAHFCLYPGLSRPLGRTLAKRAMLERLCAVHRRMGGQWIKEQSSSGGLENGQKTGDESLPGVQSLSTISIPYFEVVKKVGSSLFPSTGGDNRDTTAACAAYKGDGAVDYERVWNYVRTRLWGEEGVGEEGVVNQVSTAL
ncbi:unnamed protein product [Amoebophrya sp. A25]|nr:unnamed protein product [Amoebophrya sp. A25]|eukprot:GSA25T00001503001.1